LIYAFQKEGLRAVFLGFDIGQSDLPLRIAFPVMMSNILQWLNPNKLMFSTAQIRAGEPFPIYLDSRTDEVSIRSPSGKWERTRVTSNPLVYTKTHQTGLYRIAEGDKSRYFAVNLVDESESDIRGPDLMTAQAMKDASLNSLPRSAEPLTTEKPLWFIFLIAVLGLLLLEWYNWLWSRR
jgi:Ca-activated chloride channel family protein